MILSLRSFAISALSELWPHCLKCSEAFSLRSSLLCGYLFVLLFVISPAPPLLASAAPPPEFPTFQVPGHEKEMSTLRDLFWLHYPGSGPKATLWDEWLTDASLWPAVTNSSDSFRQQWSNVLSSRIIDPEGYVA